MMESRLCSVCGGACASQGVVDFSKSCIEAQGQVLPPSGFSVEYATCTQCGFCFAPALMAWDLETFARRIYNEDYAAVDPDYLESRPRSNAASLLSLFETRAIRHLDYGGGNGMLSRLLNEAGWPSKSYDPYADGSADPAQLGKYDLITAFEVFEHVPDVQALMGHLTALRSGAGIILFSTLVSDGQIRPGEGLDWWYAAPRNGHISLFTRKSLVLLASRHGLKLRSLADGIHVFYKNIPDWANKLFGLA